MWVFIVVIASIILGIFFGIDIVVFSMIMCESASFTSLISKIILARAKFRKGKTDEKKR